MLRYYLFWYYHWESNHFPGSQDWGETADEIVPERRISKEATVIKKKSEISLLLLLLGACLAGDAVGAPRGPINILKQLKAQQKIEKKQLQNEEKMWKKSLHGQRISHFQVLQMKHQFDRQMNELRLRQKEQLQRTKDQIKMWKSQGQHLWSGGTMIR